MAESWTLQKTEAELVKLCADQKIPSTGTKVDLVKKFSRKDRNWNTREVNVWWRFTTWFKTLFCKTKPIGFSGNRILMYWGDRKRGISTGKQIYHYLEKWSWEFVFVKKILLKKKKNHKHDKIIFKKNNVSYSINRTKWYKSFQKLEREVFIHKYIMAQTT